MEAGADADIVILSPETLQVQYVIARGKVLKSPSVTSEGVGDCCRCSDEGLLSKKAPILKTPSCIDQVSMVDEPLKDWKEAAQLWSSSE